MYSIQKISTEYYCVTYDDGYINNTVYEGSYEECRRVLMALNGYN